MTHEIGKKREIIVSFEKIFGKTVAERMRIHDSRIYAIPPCKKFLFPSHCIASVRSLLGM